MNQQDRVNFVRRSGVPDVLLNLLRRAKGLDLLNFGETRAVCHRHVPLADDTGEVAKLLDQGFNFDGLCGSKARFVKFDRLYYPLAGYCGA